jgi:hypothetical protein
LIVVDLALFFDPGYHTILFEVIAAIGFGFIFPGYYTSFRKNSSNHGSADPILSLIAKNWLYIIYIGSAVNSSYLYGIYQTTR